MKLSFLANSLCVIFACVSGFLSAANWLEDQVSVVPWNKIILIDTDTGYRVRKGKIRKKKLSRQMLCDLGLQCVVAIIQDPACFTQNVSEHSFTYQDLLRAVRLSLNDKASDKGDELKPVTSLIEAFSRVMSEERNRELVRGGVAGNGSRRDCIARFRQHVEAVESSGQFVIEPAYSSYEGSGVLPGVGVGGARHVLPAGQRPRAIGGGAAVREPLAQQSQPVQFPGPCAVCQQRVLTDGQTYGEPITNPGEEVQNPAQKKKTVGPRVAGVVLAAALTGLLIDCAVRKKRSWLARFAAATGRGFRSFFRWLKMPGRPPQGLQE
jgi:hypothetical protein